MRACAACCRRCAASARAVTASLTDEQITSNIPYGPDPERYVDAQRPFLDAGFEQVAIVPVGDDTEGTMDFWEREVLPLIDP